MVRELWVKKANPYHWPKNKITKGIAQSTMASVALAYQATIAVNSVIIKIQNIEQYFMIPQSSVFEPTIKTKIQIAIYENVTSKFFTLA